MPARLSPARAKPVKNRKPDHNQHQQNRPSHNAQQGFAHIAQPGVVQDEREHYDGADRDQNRRNGGKRECQRDEIKLDKAAFLFLVIDHVERVHDGLHPGIRAPECKPQAEDKSETEFCPSLGSKPVHLILKDLERITRQHPSYRREVVVDRRWAGKQSVQRHQCGDARKQGEQAVKDHACCDGEQTVIVDPLVGPPENILPPRPRNAPRRRGVTAPAGLWRPLMLHAPRLVGAAPCSKRPGRGLNTIAHCRITSGTPLLGEGEHHQSGIADKGPHRRATPRRTRPARALGSQSSSACRIASAPRAFCCSSTRLSSWPTSVVNFRSLGLDCAGGGLGRFLYALGPETILQ